MVLLTIIVLLQLLAWVKYARVLFGEISAIRRWIDRVNILDGKTRLEDAPNNTAKEYIYTPETKD